MVHDKIYSLHIINNPVYIIYDLIILYTRIMHKYVDKKKTLHNLCMLT